jgi:aminoglycoside phosphotransferase (APT) family kinase protein
MTAATGGFATSVWRIQAGQRQYALRVFRAHELSVLQWELTVMCAARSAGIVVPRTYAVGSHLGRPALLMDWSPGQPVAQVVRDQPWRLPLLGVDFGRLHKRLHAVSAPAGLRATWIDWPRPADRVVAERLRARALATDRLLHLDFHPLNVLALDGRLTAVLDWTNAHAGDPRADFARTVTILRLAPGLDDPVLRRGLRLFEFAWRLGYGPPGQHMALFYAWAGRAMLHDLATRFSPADLAPVQRWTTLWMNRVSSQ